MIAGALLAKYALPLKLAAGAAIVAAAFGAGWSVNGWRLESVIADERAKYASQREAAATSAGKQLADVTKERDDLANRLSGIDTEMVALQKGKKDAEDKLRAGVRAGTVGVRVNGATCPAVNAAPTGATQSSGVDSGTAAVLNPAAEQDYFALRQNINDTESKLAACQRSLGAFTGQVATTPPSAP